MPVKDEDKDETTFSSQLGARRYTRQPFGLQNTPATFQQALDTILSRVRQMTCLVYIDDVVILSENDCQHVEDIQEGAGTTPPG